MSVVTPYESAPIPTPSQGAIYRDVEVVPSALPELSSGGSDLTSWVLPYVVVLSQECDLQQDSKSRTNLPREPDEQKQMEQRDKLVYSVLVSPAWAAAPFREGNHLREFGTMLKRKNTDAYDLIKKNKDARYHYLAGWRELQVPEAVVDFKHFFTIPTETLREQYGNVTHYIARLVCPYREDLSQRFGAYLARVGLPVDHHRF